MSNIETMIKLRDTITPKSDQLNADDMITGPITVTITGVRRGSSDQPVIIDIDGGYQPYKPCKSMRRVMIAAWGDNGADWIGKSMRLYCDPSVKFGGVALGGVRISHMSHINGKFGMMLTTTRGRRSEYVVEPIGDIKEPSITDEQALNIEALLEEVGADKAAFLKHVGVQSIGNIAAKNYDRVIALIEKKRAAQ